MDGAEVAIPLRLPLPLGAGWGEGAPCATKSGLATHPSMRLQPVIMCARFSARGVIILP